MRTPVELSAAAIPNSPPVTRSRRPRKLSAPAEVCVSLNHVCLTRKAVKHTRLAASLLPLLLSQELLDRPASPSVDAPSGSESPTSLRRRKRGTEWAQLVLCLFNLSNAARSNHMLALTSCTLRRNS
mgnify:CR=1 FL=1